MAAPSSSASSPAPAPAPASPAMSFGRAARTAQARYPRPDYRRTSSSPLFPTASTPLLPLSAADKDGPSSRRGMPSPRVLIIAVMAVLGTAAVVLTFRSRVAVRSVDPVLVEYADATAAPSPIASTAVSIAHAEKTKRYFDRVMRAMQSHPSSRTYCSASTPTPPTYTRPTVPGVSGLTLVKAVLVARHGDRAPQNMMRDDVAGNVTWNCNNVEYMFLHDASPPPAEETNADLEVLVSKKVTKISEKPWMPRMWAGTCALADLTAKGRAMFVDFGYQMREIYGTYSGCLGLLDQLGFLSAMLNPDELNVHATAISRTIHSAQSFLQGLYPSGTHPTSRHVTIRTRPIDVDPLHSNKLHVQCERLARLHALSKQTPLWAHFMERSAANRARIEALAPLKASKSTTSAKALVESLKGVPAVIENLWCRRCWEKPLPCLPRDEARASLSRVATIAGVPADLDNGGESDTCLQESAVDQAWLDKSFDFWYRNNYFPNRHRHDIVRLEMGPFLRDVLGALPTPNGGKVETKLHVFLSHDGTLSGLLGALRAAPGHHTWPSYRSNVVVEVWAGKDQVTGMPREFVRILHDGRPLVTDPDMARAGEDEEGEAPWCRFGGEHGDVCPLEKFRGFLESHSVEEWEEACLVRNDATDGADALEM
ncbi:Acid phosphatase-like protein 2 [Allomyces arbusculus]|nr:Acid phosphatase-like protein 2 [Allomyces arbusculus]